MSALHELNPIRKPTPFVFESLSQKMAKVNLPDKIVCDYCKAFRGSDAFSNSELNKYRTKVVNKQPVNLLSMKLRCRNCTNRQVHEIKCQGPCGKWMRSQDFSRAQRTRGDKWCQNCVAWKNATEPEVIPDIIDYASTASNAAMNSTDGIDFDLHADDDSETNQSHISISNSSIASISALANGLHDLDLDTASSADGGVFLSDEGLSNQTFLGYANNIQLHDRDVDENSVSSASNIYNESTPSEASAHTTTRSSHISPFDTRRSSSMRVDGSLVGQAGSRSSPFAPIDQRRRQVPALSFTGWDPLGRPHELTRVPSTLDDGEKTLQASTEDVWSQGPGEWSNDENFGQNGISSTQGIKDYTTALANREEIGTPTEVSEATATAGLGWRIQPFTVFDDHSGSTPASVFKPVKQPKKVVASGTDTDYDTQSSSHTGVAWKKPQKREPVWAKKLPRTQEAGPFKYPIPRPPTEQVSYHTDDEDEDGDSLIIAPLKPHVK